MLKVAFFSLVISVTTPLWSQVAPAATGGGFDLDDEHMMTPPPVSNGVYPVNVGVESRSNYLTGGLVVTGAYNDNIFTGNPTRKTPDTTYYFVPMIALDRRTPRESISLSYDSGFTLYQKTTQLNGATQDGSAEYRFHLSPYAVVSVHDSFSQNHNLFNQSNPFGQNGVPAGPAPASIYVYPFANELSNSLNGGLEYQYGRNAMIGGGGTYSILRYSGQSNTQSLDDANTGGGSAFLSRRITRGQYVGAIYEYAKITTHPVQTTSNTHSVMGFYTMYLTQTVSLSVLGGPQHFTSTEPVTGASAGGWTPAIQGSVGYQKPHSNITAGYSRLVTGAGGLVGAFHSNVADLTARRQITKTWNIGATGEYALFKNVTPGVSAFNPGGHTISGVVSAQRSFHERIRAEIGYGRFHQSYNVGATTSLFPDCNRVFASVSYQFYRPLGR